MSLCVFFVVPNSFRYFGINKFETNQRRTAHRRLALLGDHESMWPRFLTTVLPQEIISSVCNRFLGITTSQGHCQWWLVEAGEGNHPKKIEEQLVFLLNYIVYRKYVFCIIRIRLMLFHFPKSKEKHKEVTFWKTHRISNSKHYKIIIVWHIIHTFSRIQIASSRNCKTVHQKSSPLPTKERFVPKTRHPRHPKVRKVPKVSKGPKAAAAGDDSLREAFRELRRSWSFWGGG